MGYIKTLWANRQGTGLNRFRKSGETSTHVALTNEPDSIVVQGTPVSIENLNKIEQGIFEAHEIASGKVDKINVTPATAVAAKKIAYNGQGQITDSSYLTKADLSLGSVTNDAQVRRDEMGAALGVATLDGNGVIPTSQLPNLGQGLAAVTADSTLRGNGTPNLPLGVSPPVSTVISLSQDNQESALSAKYGGTWAKSLDPAPVTRVGAVNRPAYVHISIPGSPNSLGTVDVPTVPGMMISVGFSCSEVRGGEEVIIYTARGLIGRYLNQSSYFTFSVSFYAQNFETVRFQANFACNLTLACSVECVTWREYKYVRVE